jgi:hypothetical protein
MNVFNKRERDIMKRSHYSSSYQLIVVSQVDCQIGSKGLSTEQEASLSVPGCAGLSAPGSLR